MTEKKEDGWNNKHITHEGISYVLREESLEELLQEGLRWSSNEYGVVTTHASNTTVQIEIKPPEMNKQEECSKKIKRNRGRRPKNQEEVEIHDNEFEDFVSNVHSTQKPKLRFHKERW
ncbi:hypothetical protein AKO1_012892 [Acrasis kona]|uniref:Uncharacterized protein n=1 Tax=Acrasis kona TaxID=1008807 RepID=A0AAW2YVN6_9EUKA